MLVRLRLTTRFWGHRRPHNPTYYISAMFSVGYSEIFRTDSKYWRSFASVIALPAVAHLGQSGTWTVCPPSDRVVTSVGVRVMTRRGLLGLPAGLLESPFACNVKSLGRAAASQTADLAVNRSAGVHSTTASSVVGWGRVRPPSQMIRSSVMSSPSLSGGADTRSSRHPLGDHATRASRAASVRPRNRSASPSKTS